jgi:hypothetical protein
MKEELNYSETSVLTRATRHNIPEDTIHPKSCLYSNSSISKLWKLFVQSLVGKPEGKRPLGRPRRKWIDNIKMDLLEIGLNVVDWIGLAQDRYRLRALVNAVMNFRVP